ncbi:MAG: sensor histidine kinase [Erysipelotrichaceae bacterium]|nr:sensor histidine kinase [Erysipelotrichaceae bacterium]
MWNKKLLNEYLKMKKTSIIGILGVYAILFVFVYLYRIPIEVILYPFILTIVFVLMVLLFDYIKYKEKVNKIIQICNDISSCYSVKINDKNIFDEYYLDIINELLKENRKQVSQIQKKVSDINDYFSIWVHQIKTPIASMKLKIDNEQMDLLQLASDLNRIDHYVDLVLSFLKFDEEKIDLYFRKTDVDRIMRESLKKFSNDFIIKKIKLDYKLSKREVLTDEKWLSFVFDQLLSNALKYTDKGAISIYYDEDSCLCIKDSGIGIALADMERLFEKGFTGYNGRQYKKASGIGLYMCKRMCDKLNIAISIESIVNEYTLVKLKFLSNEEYKD